MFLFMVALVAAGIGLLWQRKLINAEIKSLNQGGAQRGYKQAHASDPYAYDDATAAAQFPNNQGLSA